MSIILYVFRQKQHENFPFFGKKRIFFSEKQIESKLSCLRGFPIHNFLYFVPNIQFSAVCIFICTKHQFMSLFGRSDEKLKKNSYIYTKGLFPWRREWIEIVWKKVEGFQCSWLNFMFHIVFAWDVLDASIKIQFAGNLFDKQIELKF